MLAKREVAARNVGSGMMGARAGAGRLPWWCQRVQMAWVQEQAREQKFCGVARRCLWRANGRPHWKQ